MEHIRRDLLFEIARYVPSVLLGCEVVNQEFKSKVGSDIDFIRTLVGELLDSRDYARSMSLSECKR
jgi:hypothetical protein